MNGRPQPGGGGAGVAGARSNLSAPAGHDANRLKRLAPPVGMPPRMRCEACRASPVPTSRAVPRRQCSIASCGSISKRSWRRRGRPTSARFLATWRRSFARTCVVASSRTDFRGFDVTVVASISLSHSRARRAASARASVVGACRYARRTSWIAWFRTCRCASSCSRSRTSCEGSRPSSPQARHGRADCRTSRCWLLGLCRQANWLALQGLHLLSLLPHAECSSSCSRTVAVRLFPRTRLFALRRGGPIGLDG